MRGGELIAEYLIKENVPYVFGLCGFGKETTTMFQRAHPEPNYPALLARPGAPRP